MHVKCFFESLRLKRIQKISYVCSMQTVPELVIVPLTSYLRPILATHVLKKNITKLGFGFVKIINNFKKSY